MKTLILKGTLFSILLFVSLLSISCGGGGGDSPPPPPPSDTTAPSIPGSLIANVISAGQMNLSWNASTDNRGVAGYKIYRNGSYIRTVTSISHSDMGLAKITSYCYRVSAVDAAGNESGQSAQACATTLDSWTKQWGSAADDEARGIVTHSSGNIYVTGATWGNIDGQANAGISDAFLTKYDSSGVRQWTRYIGTSGTDWGQAVDVDSAGNIYVTGSVSGNFAGTYYGGTDVFLAKYDPAGNRIWYQQWGTAGDNFGYGVKVDSTHSVVYVTGLTDESIPGDTGSLPNIFLSKRSTSDGSASWTILDGTPNYLDYVEGIAMDGSGNVYLTGYTTGAFPGYTNNDHQKDIFLAQYDASGTRQWVKQWGSTTDNYGHGVAVDGSGNIYVTGSAGGSIDGQTGLGGDDILLTKFDNTGTKQWTKLFGTSYLDNAYGITIDNSNYIYLTGMTLGSLGGGTNLGQGDVFLMKCDSAGNEVWTKLLGTSASDAGTGAAFSVSDGYIYVTGNTSGNLDGNINAGGEDVFLLKYNSSGTKQ